MSVLVKRNGSPAPSLADDFFSTGKFFRSFFPELRGGLADADLSSRVPSANITESNENYKIELAAPGLEKKDFKVELNGGVLTISAEKQEEKKEEKKNYRRREFSYSSFSRSFELPENVSDKIEAKYEDGLLRLVLPKKEITVSKPKKEIKVA